jgi:hypothetical protein
MLIMSLDINAPLLYFLPISSAGWFGGFLTALGIIVVSIAVSLLTDFQIFGAKLTLRS